jgi:hypothetical protein
VYFDPMLVTLDLSVDRERGESRSELVGTEVSSASFDNSRNTSEIDHTPVVAYSEDGQNVMRLEDLALVRPFGLILLDEIGFDIDSKC